MEISTAQVDCECGESLLDRVFVDLHSNEDSWLACPACGWSSRPAWYEPGGYYTERYGDGA